MSKREWRHNFKRIFDKTGGRCFYCGHGLLPDDNDLPADADGLIAVPPQYRLLTRDHLIPRCRNGSNDESNLVPSCPNCNARKGKRTLEEYRAWVGDRDGTGTAVFFGEGN